MINDFLMYVWQMNDGRWHISLETRHRGLFSTILHCKDAFALYDRGYETEREARNAERRIRSLIGC